MGTQDVFIEGAYSGYAKGAARRSLIVRTIASVICALALAAAWWALLNFGVAALRESANAADGKGLAGLAVTLLEGVLHEYFNIELTVAFVAIAGILAIGTISSIRVGARGQWRLPVACVLAILPMVVAVIVQVMAPGMGCFDGERDFDDAMCLLATLAIYGAATAVAAKRAAKASWSFAGYIGLAIVAAIGPFAVLIGALGYFGILSALAIIIALKLFKWFWPRPVVGI